MRSAVVSKKQIDDINPFCALVTEVRASLVIPRIKEKAGARVHRFPLVGFVED